MDKNLQSNDNCSKYFLEPLYQRNYLPFDVRNELKDFQSVLLPILVRSDYQWNWLQTVSRNVNRISMHGIIRFITTTSEYT